MTINMKTHSYDKVNSFVSAVWRHLFHVKQQFHPWSNEQLWTWIPWQRKLLSRWERCCLSISKIFVRLGKETVWSCFFCSDSSIGDLACQSLKVTFGMHNYRAFRWYRWSSMNDWQDVVKQKQPSWTFWEPRSWVQNVANTSKSLFLAVQVWCSGSP